MLRVIKFLSLMLFCHLVLISAVCYGDEEALFSSDVAPDALIALDLSGSMDRPPTGDWGYASGESGGYCTGDKLYGSPQPGYSTYCANSVHLYGATAECKEPFLKSGVDCRKKIIAKKAIYGLLDADGTGNDNQYKSNKITGNDEKVLGVRLGYMKFQCISYTFTYPSQDSHWDGGDNYVRVKFQDLNQSAQGYFYDIFDKVSSDSSDSFVCPSHPDGTWARTPLAGTLNEAKEYLDWSKDHGGPGGAADPLKDCRKKFVILITDGWDTVACGADPRYSLSTTKGYSYKRRTATVAAAKALKEAGYSVFVIGFGLEMPKTLANTLNWAAYFGGTDNPDEVNKENGVTILPGKTPTSPPAITAATACNNVDACNNFDPHFGYPGGHEALGNDIGADCSYSPNPDCCTLAPNDPGFKNLTGYAFFANDATALKASLSKAMEYIKEARYSFTVSSVSAARLLSENFLYEASFIPVTGDSFWLGHLKKYEINDNGEVVRPSKYDAGDKLLDKAASSRSMWTYLGGNSLRNFDTSISPIYFGYNDDAAGKTSRTAVVEYFRGVTTANPDAWKLGDIFHSNPITIASPPVFYNDFRSPDAYAEHRADYGTRERTLVVGANDGQFHAFKADTLEEKWSFIPPNFLPKLQLVSHAADPTTQSHQFFVDGPVTVAEAWLGSGEGLDKPGVTGKNAGDWRTLLIFGLGRGVRESHLKTAPTYLWSSSPNCDSGFFKKYNTQYPYYCGYYAFDVTNTSQTPTYKWRINLTDVSQGKFLDEPWSKMVTGRVRINGEERWVGFIGGGYNHPNNENYGLPDDTPETAGKRGKGFFVVDLRNGDILWSYTKDNDANMNCIPAAPSVVDWDSDGFIDTAYIPDLGGNMWRFRFCSYEDYKNDQSCNTNDWKGGRLYASTEGRFAFTRPTVASDQANQLWVFWGTGNKLDPKGTGQDRFFAVKDTFVPAKSGTTPPSYTISNLQNISSTTYAGVLPGWYILFPGTGEKTLSDPTVFAGMVLFTTYTPPPGAVTCSSVGTGSLYAMAMMPLAINNVLYTPGAGLWAGGARSMSLGSGIATSPIISQKPREKPGATDVFVTVSGGAGGDTVVKSLSEIAEQKSSPASKRFGLTPPQAQITHWRDQRLQ